MSIGPHGGRWHWICYKSLFGFNGRRGAQDTCAREGGDSLQKPSIGRSKLPSLLPARACHGCTRSCSRFGAQ
jgi:hypothetical protein